MNDEEIIKCLENITNDSYGVNQSIEDLNTNFFEKNGNKGCLNIVENYDQNQNMPGEQMNQEISNQITENEPKQKASNGNRKKITIKMKYQNKDIANKKIELHLIFMKELMEGECECINKIDIEENFEGKAKITKLKRMNRMTSLKFPIGRTNKEGSINGTLILEINGFKRAKKSNNTKYPKHYVVTIITSWQGKEIYKTARFEIEEYNAM